MENLSLSPAIAGTIILYLLGFLYIATTFRYSKCESTINVVCCIIVALTLSFAMSDGYPCAAVAAPLLLGICWSVKCIYNLKEDNQ